MSENKNKGFTLVELLVVIAIIGILASVVLVSLNSARSRARDARRISDLHQVALALESYYDANGNYPAALTDLTAPTAYLTTTPADPTNTGVYVYAYNSAGCTPANQRYILKSVLENFSSVLSSDADGTSCGQAAGFCGGDNNAEGNNERAYCVQP